SVAQTAHSRHRQVEVAVGVEVAHAHRNRQGLTEWNVVWGLKCAIAISQKYVQVEVLTSREIDVAVSIEVAGSKRVTDAGVDGRLERAVGVAQKDVGRAGEVQHTVIVEVRGDERSGSLGDGVRDGGEEGRHAAVFEMFELKPA